MVTGIVIVVSLVAFVAVFCAGVYVGSRVLADRFAVYIKESDIPDEMKLEIISWLIDRSDKDCK